MAFPKALSYTRFVVLIPHLFVPLCAFLQMLRASYDSIGFIDSTPIGVRHNKRTFSHRMFSASAKTARVKLPIQTRSITCFSSFLFTDIGAMFCIAKPTTTLCMPNTCTGV